MQRSGIRGTFIAQPSRIPLRSIQATFAGRCRLGGILSGAPRGDPTADPVLSVSPGTRFIRYPQRTITNTGAAMTTPPSEIVFLVEDAPEGGYQAQALGHAIYTAADDAQTLKTNVRDAVRCHFEDPQRPGLIRLHYVRDEVIAA